MCGADGFDVLHAAAPDYKGSGDRFDVVTCVACGLTQTNPRPTRAAIARYYPPGYGPHHEGEARPWGASRRALHAVASAYRRLCFTAFRLVARPADRFPRPAVGADRLLDVGTGAGWYVARMARLGWEVRGVEPDERAAAEAALAAGVPAEAILVASAEDAEFADGSFDLVTLAHVIEHLHDPLHVLRKVRRWLTPGGRVMIWCPNIGSLESRVFGRAWFGLEVPRHLYHFTPQTLSALLAKAGFEVTAIAAEEQASTLAGSVRNALSKRRSVGNPRGVLLHGLEPVAGIDLALGDKPTMVVTAAPAPQAQDGAD